MSRQLRLLHVTRQELRCRKEIARCSTFFLYAERRNDSLIGIILLQLTKGQGHYSTGNLLWTKSRLKMKLKINK